MCQKGTFLTLCWLSISFIFILQVREFVNGYMVLREMGFEANSVVEALFSHDNDKEAAAHFLSTSS